MNKNGFIENWGGFAILTGVGLLVVVIALKIWSAQEFEIDTFTKIVMIIGCPIAAFIFNRMWLED